MNGNVQRQREQNYHHRTFDEPQHYHGLLVALVAAFGIGFGLSYYQIVSDVAHVLRRMGGYLYSGSNGGISTLEWLGELSIAKSKLERELMGDYKSYYGLLFDQGAMDGIFVSNSISRQRLLRRLQLKLLQNDGQSSFTWVTGGDSAAAGHGNLFSQSYTMVLEATAREAFRTVGINFVAKNYAMGGYVSAPELALCMESIYGSDIDVLMWDFGLQEADDRVGLWGSRAAVHPTKPILFAMETVDSPVWTNQFLQMEANGMGTILMDHKKGMSEIRHRVDDSTTGEGGKPHIPSTLRNYRCNGSVEGVISCNNDPMRFGRCYMDTDDAKPCIEAKFKTKKKCMDAKHQSSWHPGWKEHYLRGRLLGVYLVDALEEALIQLDAMLSAHDRDRVLKVLLANEEDDYDLAINAPIPHVQAFDEFKETMNNVGADTLFKSNAVCHTALLPSQERFDGTLTETKEKVGPSNYERGLNRYYMKDPIKDGKMPLVFDPNDRQRCIDELEIDHKDFFWAREGDGWLTKSVPNPTEISVYRRPGQPVKGMIMICLKICPLKRCPDGVMGFGPLKRNTNKLVIRMDGQDVKSVQKFGDCHFLQGDNGQLQWGPGKFSTPQAPGQYKLSFLVNDREKHNLKISSFIVF